MPNFVIVHAATSVVRRITTDNPPPMQADEISIEVPADYDIAPPVGKTGRGWLKVDAQGNKSTATQEEHDAALTIDTAANQTIRAALANLKDKGLALHQATPSAETKAFLVALNGFIDVLVARHQARIAED